MAATVARMRLCLALVLLLMSLLAGFSQFQPSSSPRADFPVTDGPVHAILETNGIVFLGGDFSSVSPNQTRTALLDIVNGLEDAAFPAIHGVLNAAAPDGQGGWYLGGRFTLVGGEPRTNLARILSNNTVDPVWKPAANDPVHALIVEAGTVYVGGQFTNIAGQARRNLAALDAVTGAATDWNPDICCDAGPDQRSRILALEVSNGRLFAGGSFWYINGQIRNHVAALDLASGSLIPWAEEFAEQGNFVSSLRVTGDTLLVGGRFQFIGGSARNNLAALDTATGAALSWDSGVNGDVMALELRGGTVYAGGNFNFAGGQPRSRLAAFDLHSGAVTAWNPEADDTVLRFAISGNSLFVGGNFSFVGGQERQGLAALSADSGFATLWRPSATGRSVQAIAINGSRILASSEFHRDAKSRSRLAALDGRTGRVLDWNPGADNTVLAFAFANNTVFAGGDFLQVAGTPRSRIAAIDATTGELSTWGDGLAGPNARVLALAVGGDRVFAAGGFTSVGAIFSPGLAAFDLASAAPIAWRPQPNRTVLAIDVFGDTVYAAGNFTSISMQSRRAFAAVDALSPTLTAWNPDIRGSGSAGWTIAYAGDRVYAGGSFTNVAGQRRRHLVALDTATAIVTSWDPGLNSPGDLVQKIAVAGDAIYVAGAFSSIGGQPRSSLAALDRTNASALDWNPEPRSTTGISPVTTVSVGANAVYVGGAFTSLRRQPHQHFAAFAPIGQPIFTLEPTGGLVPRGQSRTLSADAPGQQPISYQWQLNGTNLINATGTTLLLASAQPAQSGSYSVIASNALGAVTSSSALLTVTEPLVITRQLGNSSTQPGSNVTLFISATGSPPPQFQWKLNGAIIPGQSLSSLQLDNAQPASSGIYSVAVFNGIETIESLRAALSVAGPSATSADMFANRTILINASGTVIGHNASATREPGEPNHAGKPGGRSIWYSWTAPSSGIATFATRGCAFDTLLAVYTNASVSGTNLLGADDDRGGLLSSIVSFNAIAGVQYQIAVDGYAGASGRVVLNWSLEAIPEQLPRILSHPMTQTVVAGSTITLNVSATEGTVPGYQWLRNGLAVRGATNDSLTLMNIQATQVGAYSVIVREGARELESLPAAIEIGPLPAVTSQDKFQDLFLTNFTSSIRMTLGTVGSQVFDNTGATTQSLEPNHGNAAGGGSKWFRFRASTNAVLQFDTIGSDIDTTLAVYTGTNLTALSLVARDNNSAPDASRSLVRFNATAGVDYQVAVDGFNGAQGIIQLNWQLGLPPVIVPASFDPVVRLGDTFTLSAGAGGTLPVPFYQWKLDGNVIVGATNSTLTLTNFQATQAGNYSVAISNFAGGLTNNVATVSFLAPIVLNYELVSTNGRPAIRIKGPITNELVLEAAADLSNWLPLQTIDSIVPLNFIDADFSAFPKRFYRGLITPSAGIRHEWLTNGGGRVFHLFGPLNQSLIIEAATDLSDWQPLHTNALVVPLDFTDLESTNFPTRFYRLR